jgi:four helix bundle protein
VEKCNAPSRTPENRGFSSGIPVALRADVPPWDLIERTRIFALAVLKFCRRLPATAEARDAARQLRRAATSGRSNYRSARKSRSRAEFRSKLQIAFEEADECVDWLEYLKDGRIQEDVALLQEAREIASILATAVKTSRRNASQAK